MSNIKNLEVNYDMLSDEKKHDLYLRKLATGEIQGPPTGKPSQDKPWLKYYSEEAIASDDIINLSIAERMISSAKKFEGQNALKYIKSNIKYSDTIKKGMEIAKSLKALGVKKGDYVTVCLPCVPEFGYFLFAINLLGAKSNWLDFRSGRDELVEFMNDMNSQVIITFDGVCDKVNSAIKIHNNTSNNKIEKVVKVSPSDSLPFPLSTALNVKKYLASFSKGSSDIRELEINYNRFLKLGKNISHIEPVKFDKDESAVIVYTGGTTGKGKGVELTNENFNAVVNGYENSSINFKAGESFLHFLPPWTAYGTVIFYLSYIEGLKCILIPQLDPSTYDKLILKERPNHTTGIPKNLEILVNSKFIKCDTDLSFFKTAAVGADTMNINLEKKSNKFLALHNSEANIIKGYGMTEGCATIATTSNSVNKVGSVGIPMIRNNISVFDTESHEELPYGKIGELCFNGVSMMKQYYNNFDATNLAIVRHADGAKWFHTGDLGYIDSDGFIYVVDRIKRMFVRSGFKLFSSEIENAVCSHPAVKLCAAVGVENEFEGSIPIVNIVLKEDTDVENINSFIDEINEICKNKLYEYYFPLNYRIVNEIPYTKNGKVDFMKLKSDSSEFMSNKVKIKNKLDYVILDALPKNAVGKTDVKALEEL